MRGKKREECPPGVNLSIMEHTLVYHERHQDQVSNDTGVKGTALRSMRTVQRFKPITEDRHDKALWQRDFKVLGYPLLTGSPVG